MRTALTLVGVLLLAGCAPGRAGGEPLTVYAAASLRDAFTALAEAYESDTGTKIVLSFDASSTLRAQIEQGAPADVFASADRAHAQTLVAAGMTDGEAIAFAASPLAVVVAADAPLRDWRGLANSNIRIVAAGEDVPITRYALELVAALDAREEAPDGFGAAYRANVVSREDNVRAALAKVELGEADAAIVYETDTRAAGGVRTLPLPAEVDVLAEYVAATLDDGSSAGGDFVEWLLESRAQTILREHGFVPPP